MRLALKRLGTTVALVHRRRCRGDQIEMVDAARDIEELARIASASWARTEPGA